MKITDFDNLYNSMLKCKRGVLWKDSVAHFLLNGIEEVSKLETQLENGTYKARPPYRFSITSPKPRELVSICFRDRVYQRSLNDNVLYPTMTKSFIYDNHACQIGKGTDKARERLKCFLNRFHRKHGCDGYVLQVDIHGYYANMSHERTEELFKAKLSDEDFARTKNVLDWQYMGENGYNPGSQMIQIAGISYLDGFDHFCKEKLKLKYYIRYMDDIIVIHHEKAFLEKCLEEMKSELSNVCLSINEKKTRIFRIKDGILFLGFVYRLKDTGKVVMTINPKNVKKQKRKLKKMVRLSKEGKRTKEEIDTAFECWKANAKKGDSYSLVARIEKYYKELWDENHETDNEPER